MSLSPRATLTMATWYYHLSPRLLVTTIFSLIVSTRCHYNDHLSFPCLWHDAHKATWLPAPACFSLVPSLPQHACTHVCTCAHYTAHTSRTLHTWRLRLTQWPRLLHGYWCIIRGSVHAIHIATWIVKWCFSPNTSFPISHSGIIV